MLFISLFWNFYCFPLANDHLMLTFYTTSKEGDATSRGKVVVRHEIHFECRSKQAV